jgi:protein-S-isoprenylcysteine O-methyltransferase Ste14
MSDPAAVPNSRSRHSFAIRTVAGATAGAALGTAWAWFHHGAAAPPLPHSFHDAKANWERAGFSPGILLSLLLWVAFSMYWEVAARKAAATLTSESPWSRGLHLALVSVAQVLVLLPVPGLRARLFPSTNVLIVTGLVLEVAFVLFAVWARERLGRNWSGAVAIKVDQQLVRSGPYRLVRHPIYSALLGLYFSLALVWGELHALIGLVVVGFAYWRKIRIEEQYLGTVFGPAYDEYRHATRAVIPGVW